MLKSVFFGVLRSVGLLVFAGVLSVFFAGLVFGWAGFYASLLVTQLVFFGVFFMALRGRLRGFYALPRIRWGWCVFVGLVGVLGVLLANLLCALVLPAPVRGQVVLSELSSSVWLGLFFGVVCAPLVEEFVFRVCMRGLIGHDLVWVIVNSLLFGLSHAQWELSGFGWWTVFYPALVACFSGLLFSLFYWWCGRWWVSVLAHAGSNLLVLLIVFL